MIRLTLLLLLLLSGCMTAAAKSPEAALPCWHVVVRTSYQEEYEIRAPNQGAAEGMARAAWEYEPTDPYWEDDAEPAESTAVRTHRNPAAVCR